MSNQGNGGGNSGPGHGNPGQGGGQGQGNDKSTIRIDRETFHVTEDFLTGAQLRALPEPDVGGDRDLFEVVPGGSDRKIEADERVKMRDGLRFFTAPAQINPG